MESLEVNVSLQLGVIFSSYCESQVLSSSWVQFHRVCGEKTGH